MAAQVEIRAYRDLNKKLVNIQERGVMLAKLVSKGVGLRQQEENRLCEEGKLRGNNLKKEGRKLVTLAMKIKIRDNKISMDRVKRLRNKSRGKVEALLGKNSKTCRGLVKEVKKNCEETRKSMKKTYKKKVAFLVDKYGVKKKCDISNLVQKRKYGGADLFSDECNMKKELEERPQVICGVGEEMKISDDEASCLSLGQKFCIINNLEYIAV